MGNKSSAPAAPNYAPIQAATQAQTQEAGREFDQSMAMQQQENQQSQAALKWAQNAYQANVDQNNAIEQSQMNTQAAATQAAQQAQQRYNTVFQPLQDQYVQEAQNYDTPGQEALNQGQAQAQVAQTFDAQRQAAQQNLEGFGIDPSSTRYSAMDLGLRTQQAAAQAAAGTQSILNTKQTGLGLLSNAINIGAGMPANINAGQNTSVGAGSAAGNLGLATTASGANTMGTATQYGALAQGYGGLANGAINSGVNASNAWGNALNMGYQNQLSTFNANQNASSGIGAIAGQVLGGAMTFMAEGGAVPPSTAIPGPGHATTGGRVPLTASPSGGHVADDVPARLTADEFVVPRDVAKWKGEEFFQKMIQKSRQDKATKSPAQPQTGIPLPTRAPTFQSRPMQALPTR